MALSSTSSRRLLGFQQQDPALARELLGKAAAGDTQAAEALAQKAGISRQEAQEAALQRSLDGLFALGTLKTSTPRTSPRADFTGAEAGRTTRNLGGLRNVDLPRTTRSLSQDHAVDALALPPSCPPARPLRTVVDTVDETGRRVELLEDGGARLHDGNTVRTFSCALDLARLGDLSALNAVMPVLDEQGALWLLKRAGKSVQLLPVREDGPLDEYGSLRVESGKLYVVANPLVRDGMGQLRGVLANQQVVSLLASDMVRSRMDRSLRESPLRSVPCDDGLTRFINHEGFAVDADGSVLQQSALVTKDGLRVWTDSDGHARVCRQRLEASVPVDLAFEHLPDGPVHNIITDPIAPGATGLVKEGVLYVVPPGQPAVAFSMDGVPAFPVTGEDAERLSRGTEVAGIGTYKSAAFVYLEVPGGHHGFYRVDARQGDERLAVLPDGRGIIINATGQCRQGTWGTPPTALVHDGQVWRVGGTDGADPTVCGAKESHGRLGAFRIRGSTALPVDATDRTFRMMRGEILDRIACGGVEHHVLCQPSAGREAFATSVVDALQIVNVDPETDLWSRETREALACLQRVLDANGTDGVKAARKQLGEELKQGSGSLMDGVLPDPAVQRLEALMGYLPAQFDPFIFTVSGGAGRVRRRGSGFQAPGEASFGGAFVQEGSGLRPATVQEVSDHFHRVTDGVSPRSWQQLPRADAVRVTHQLLRTFLQVEAGGEQRLIPVQGKPGPDHPDVKQLAKWIAQLPLCSLHQLREVQLGGPDPNGQARFYPSTGTLVLSAVKDYWNRPECPLVIAHEVAGHGTELGDPLVYRLLLEARLLDGVYSGTWHGTDDPYGDTNLAESFAVGVQEYAANSEHARTTRPHFARLLDLLFAGDGKPRDPLDLRIRFENAAG